MFMPFTITQGMMVHFMIVSLTLWLRYSQLMIKQSLSLLVMNARHSEWLESVSPTDRHGRDALDFCNLAGCEQLVRYPTHIAGNRLDLVVTDALDIVHVFVGNTLGISDQCFVSCVLRCVICTGVQCQKHRTNWDNVHCEVWSFTWSTILRLVDPLDVYD